MSKALATIATQPLIVAKVGLQSKPPPARNGKPFSSFVEVMKFIIQHEGVLGLFKGIGPQILKGFLVQGILMTTKERSVSLLLLFIRKLTSSSHRVELMFILFIRYLKSLRFSKLSKTAEATAASATAVAHSVAAKPVTTTN